jgi:hypothetical protein
MSHHTDDPGAWGAWAGDAAEARDMRTLATTAPVSPEISERVWAAHQDNVERMEATALNGDAEAKVRWNPKLRVMELVASRGLEDLVKAFGGEVVVSLKF